MSMETKLVHEICYIIFEFYHSKKIENINNKSFETWANTLATTNGIIIAYSKGRPYYNQSCSISDPFMIEYEQYLTKRPFVKWIPNYIDLTGDDLKINYSSFTDLYCDKMSYFNLNKSNDLKLLCIKYDQHKYTIFNNSQHISFTYYRWAVIVFDIIWSLIWCL